MTFALHSRLEQDTTVIGDFPLCRVLLSKEDIGPWLILVPKIDNLREIHHLPHEQQIQLISESSAVASILESSTNADKINIGALGNMVPQLHIHHIARFKNDIAWPGPVWGNTQGIQRGKEAQEEVCAKWRDQLSKVEGFIPANSQ
ncbi:HIT domain-containing protein [Veronia pacifica]|uniref:HIT family hydrolase n=1 Tax=Veronia pacifica TaxID=1080227 RepID=A0A1C3ERH9_9GAMM|nr:HIT domain-containing protein [Veronia pacifica]ODA35845.1 HIT family hydrolase [Veronia pacifica]